MFVIHMGDKNVCKTHWYEKRKEDG